MSTNPCHIVSLSDQRFASGSCGHRDAPRRTGPEPGCKLRTYQGNQSHVTCELWISDPGFRVLIHQRPFTNGSRAGAGKYSLKIDKKSNTGIAMVPSLTSRIIASASLCNSRPSVKTGEAIASFCGQLESKFNRNSHSRSVFCTSDSCRPGTKSRDGFMHCSAHVTRLFPV